MSKTDVSTAQRHWKNANSKARRQRSAQRERKCLFEMRTFLIVFIIPIPIYSVVAGVGTLLLVGCPSFVEPVLSTRLYKNNSKFEKRKEN